MDAPEPAGPDAAACRQLVDALPDSVADQPRRPVEPPSSYAAAWGDPAIVLTCGGPMPADFDAFAACTEANGVGWFVPDQQLREPDGPVEMTTVGRAQNVHVTLPLDYLPPATAMADLAAPISRTIEEVRPCV